MNPIDNDEHPTEHPEAEPSKGGSGGGGSSSPPERPNTRTVSAGLTSARYADAMKLPLERLGEFGLTEVSVLGQPALRLPYSLEDGSELSVRFQHALDGDSRLRWRNGSKASLYGQSRLKQARDANQVAIVGSEDDCHVLWHHGFPAVGIPAAETWDERWAEYFDGIDFIYVIVDRDRDDAPNNHWLASSRLRDRARVVTIVPYDTITALHLSDTIAFATVFQNALANATPWNDIEEVKRAQNAQEALEASRALLHDPNLLGRVGEFIAANGFAGDVDPALLVYVAITSRLLERPMNIACVAPSAAGKNTVLEAALACVPEEAVHRLSASSERALIYTNASFKHRTVVVMEADSLSSEGPAASAIRSIAADNVMIYEVTEKNPTTGQFATRRIIKEGPTGLLTTSTRSLDEQLGTRHLELLIPDDPDQTREVMRAHARSVSGITRTRPDSAPFHALQRWLTLAPARKVIVPFANVLVDLMPLQPSIRMRRDTRQLLTCVQTIALLRQRQGDRLRADGVVVAQIADYADARRLLAPVFDSIAAEGVSPIIRETVQLVDLLGETSEAQLAERLNLARSTVSDRVKKAIAGGWLENLEWRRGYPARLVRGLPLPEPLVALPEPDAVQKLFDAHGSYETDEPSIPSEHEL